MEKDNGKNNNISGDSNNQDDAGKNSARREKRRAARLREQQHSGRDEEIEKGHEKRRVARLRGRAERQEDRTVSGDRTQLEASASNVSEAASGKLPFATPPNPETASSAATRPGAFHSSNNIFSSFRGTNDSRGTSLLVADDNRSGDVDPEIGGAAANTTVAGSDPNTNGFVIATAVLADAPPPSAPKPTPVPENTIPIVSASPAPPRRRVWLIVAGVALLVVLAASIPTSFLLLNRDEGGGNGNPTMQPTLPSIDSVTSSPNGSPIPSVAPSTAPSVAPSTAPQEGSSSIRMGRWNQIGGDINGLNPTDESGFSVSLNADGTTIAVGSTRFGDNIGNVRVFQLSLDNMSWELKGGIIEGVAPDEIAGRSVSLSDDGNILAVGSPRDNDSDGLNSFVRVYQYDTVGDDWTQIGEDLNVEKGFDDSGFSVSLSANGNIVAIGSPRVDFPGCADCGSVTIFEQNGESWTMMGDSIIGIEAQDVFGFAVSLSSNGRTVAIGAPRTKGSGYVQVRRYNEAANRWDRMGEDFLGSSESDKTGLTVSLSSDGSVVAFGAPGNDSNGVNTGVTEVYSFSESSGIWSQRGSTIPGEDIGEESGHSVSISDDGNVLAISAPRHNGFGTFLGNVRLFEFDESTQDWERIDADDILGENRDDFGWAVSLSADGSSVAGSSRLHADKSGQVRVFKFGPTQRK